MSVILLDSKLCCICRRDLRVCIINPPGNGLCLGGTILEMVSVDPNVEREGQCCGYQTWAKNCGGKRGGKAFLRNVNVMCIKPGPADATAKKISPSKLGLLFECFP